VSAPNPRDLRDLAAAYALGALDPEERKAFEAWLATSEDARREVAEYREIGALMALAEPAPEPGPSLKDRIGRRIAGERVVPIARPEAAGRWATWLAAAAVLAAVLLGVSRAGLVRALAERQTAITALRDSLTNQQAQLAARDEVLNALLAPGVSLTRLVSPAAQAPTVLFYYDARQHRAVMHASNLSPAASGRAYQLWFIPKHGKPIPSVVFNSGGDGHALVAQIRLPEGVDLAAAAITNEPAAGSEQPTTTPIVVGPLAAS
jgi:anti-sigma-K factor RskA